MNGTEWQLAGRKISILIFLLLKPIMNAWYGSSWEDSKIQKYQQLAYQALSAASEFWDDPEAIPLMTSLFSSLLVKCAFMVFDTNSPKYSKDKTAFIPKNLTS